MRRVMLLFVLLCATQALAFQSHAKRTMQLGVDADDWSHQIANPQFQKSLKEMGINFIVWHLLPGEEADAAHMRKIEEFCRRNHWHYLFNNEMGNYRRHVKRFHHPNGTYRFDLTTKTLQQLKNDPLFLGVVYDESDLMQEMLGMPDRKGGTIQPYFVNTRNMTARQAYFAVSAAVSKLRARYAKYGKLMVMDMTFPADPFPFTRAGVIVAPKLLKENFNDLMYSIYRGAALEYGSKQLWACIDLWFLNKFPMYGKQQPGGHTPEQLFNTLKYAYRSGFDSVYIEQVKALMNKRYQLTAYGKKVVAFQHWRKSHKMGNWRTAPIDYVITRFPDGYWGQAFSSFIPDHPYGSWLPNKHLAQDAKWFQLLHKLSHGTIPKNADTWNALRDPSFRHRPYQSMAGLPPMIVIDPFGTFHGAPKAKRINLTH